MFFTLSNELINRDGEKYEFVYGQEKESMALGLTYMVGQEMNKSVISTWLQEHPVCRSFQ